jgi:hypothetical protein
MADKFINQLPTGTALTGTELVPIWQNGATAQTTAAAFLSQPVATFTAGLINATILEVSTITELRNTTNFQNASGVTGLQVDGINRILFIVSTTDGTSNAKFSVTGTGGTAQAQMNCGGSFQVSLGFAANGNTPQTKASVNAACTDLPTVIALTNQIRAALIANGICQ